MKHVIVAAGLVFLVACSGFSQRRGFRGPSSEELPQGNTPQEKRILAVLGEARQNGETYANVPASDGKMLRILAEAAGAKHVVEIGTSTGLSGLWFSLALQKTGGRLTTHEVDPGRAETARRHFRDAGVDGIVTVVLGDAHEKIRQLKGPIDVVFIDAEKEGYTDYLNTLLPLVRPGGLILAHNIDMVRDYVQAVNANPALETVYYTAGGGLGITMKK